VELAAKQPEVAKPAIFDDLVPFLRQRMDKEQENIKGDVVQALLKQNVFLAKVWETKITELQKLWSNIVTGRESQDTNSRSYFVPVCKELVKRAFHNWENRQEEALEFVSDFLDASAYVPLLVEVQRQKDDNPRSVKKIPLEAVQWAFDQQTRNGGLSLWYDAVSALCLLHNGSWKKTWVEYPFVELSYIAMLDASVKPAEVVYALVTYLDMVLEDNVQMRRAELADSTLKESKKYEPWFVPLEHPAYQKLVKSTYKSLRALEVDPGWSLNTLRRRVELLTAFTAEDIGYKGTEEEEVQAAAGIITSLKAAGRTAPRGVMWEARAMSEQSDSERCAPLLEAVLEHLDAQQEGMARIVEDDHTHIFNRLRGEESHSADSPAGTSGNLLSEIVDAYLDCKPAQKDERVMKLAKRQDGHLLIFYGELFAMHLACKRQEVLHEFLQRLVPVKSPKHEWYHHDFGTEGQVPRLATFRGKAALWHRSTQQEFFRVALDTTEEIVLQVLPQLAFVDTTPTILEILAAYPREQSSRPTLSRSASSAWDMVTHTGDLMEEIERRYAEIPAPLPTDVIQSRQVDVLLCSVGRMDHTDRAMQALSKYASEIKMAKNALVRTVPGLSTHHLRRVLAEIVGDRATSIPTRIAMLRLVLDLQVRNPLEIFEKAWKDGKCHRDVAVAILTKLALVEAVDVDKTKAKKMYLDILERSQEDQQYICSTILKDISGSPWVLDFLAEVVCQYAYVPAVVGDAYSALVNVRTGVSPTDFAKAATRLLKDGRVLKDSSMHGDRNLAAEWTKVCPDSMSSTLQRIGIEDCEHGTLWDFVQECFHQTGFAKNYSNSMSLWAFLIRGAEDVDKVTWAAEFIRIQESTPANAYVEMAKAAVRRVQRNSGRVDAAKRAVALAFEEVGEDTEHGKKVILECWAVLVSNDGSKADMDQLLAVKRVKESLTAEVAKILYTGRHRWEALQWFSDTDTCVAPPHTGLQHLVDLCVSAAKDDTHRKSLQPGETPSFDKALVVLKRHTASSQCARFVEQLPTSADVLRKGLEWLTPLFPRRAAELYPRLLTIDPPQASDVSALLACCMKYRVDLPVVPEAAALIAMNDLRACKLEAARLQAVRVLRKLDKRAEIDEMLKDESVSVRKAAQAAVDFFTAQDNAKKEAAEAKGGRKD